jgi:hypothetical protein
MNNLQSAEYSLLLSLWISQNNLDLADCILFLYLRTIKISTLQFTTALMNNPENRCLAPETGWLNTRKKFMSKFYVQNLKFQVPSHGLKRTKRIRDRVRRILKHMNKKESFRSIVNWFQEHFNEVRGRILGVSAPVSPATQTSVNGKLSLASNVSAARLVRQTTRRTTLQTKCTLHVKSLSVLLHLT